MRILLYDSKVMVGKEKMIDGYVFIEDNKIEEIGEGRPPEDLRDSELVYSLKNKLIIPSFPAFLTHITLFPFRFSFWKKLDFLSVWNKIMELDNEKILKISMLGLTHLLEKGYMEIYTIDPSIEILSEISEKTGVMIKGFLPTDIEYKGKIQEEYIIGEVSLKGEANADFVRISDKNNSTIGFMDNQKRVYTCEKSREENPYGYCIGHNILYSIKWPAYNNEKCFSNSMEILEKIFKNSVPRRKRTFIEKGETANLVVIGLDNPIFAGLDTHEIVDVIACNELIAPQIEMGVSNGNIILDGGQQLVVPKRELEQAAKIVYALKNSIL